MVGAIFLTIIITGVVVAFFYEQEVRYLSRENWMFRRLLSEQAKLHKMSLDAYIAMLREAQRHTDGQHFDR